MEYIEIILEDIRIDYLEHVLNEILKYDNSCIISSHFYDKKNNRDTEYQDIKNFEDYFYDSGTGSLFLEKLRFGIELEQAVIIISWNVEAGDITIHVPEQQFMSIASMELCERLRTLFQILLEIQKSYDVENVIVGYEPAGDDDMKMIQLNREHIQIFNEDVSQSSFAQSLYHVVREITTTHIAYPTKRTIEKLARDLNLPESGKNMQDWQYEVADATRVEDFLIYYENNCLSLNEKITLMELILESYNDYVTDNGTNPVVSKRICQVLQKESKLFLNTLEYWSCENDDLEDGFAITPLIRKVKADL